MKYRIPYIILLHVVLGFFSVAGILSKLAAREDFLSIRFCVYYAGIIFILFIYAICWQQIIKRLPLTLAYANRAVTVIWAMVWGLLFFSEKINYWKICGAILVISGIIIYVSSDGENDNKTEHSETRQIAENDQGVNID